MTSGGDDERRGARRERRDVTRRGPVLAAALAFAVAGCADDGAGRGDPTRSVAAPKPGLTATSTTTTTAPTTTAPATPAPSPAGLPAAAAWEPTEAESFPDVKRAAARVAEAITTYPQDSTPASVAASVAERGDLTRAGLQRDIAPVVDAGAPSVGEVVYPQMSGHTATSAGVMVLVRQRVRRPAGSLDAVTRVIDVRLTRDTSRRAWRVSEIAGVGGRATPRPRGLPPQAARALDHPDLFLPDSARWDIFRGEIDPALLGALADAADRSPISVLVLRSGHPRNVWATARPSAHAAGHAADIHAVAGRLVVRQRGAGSAAHALAGDLVDAGAEQVGSPWDLAAGRRAFTDAVHEDHLHLQWSAGGSP